MNAYISKPIDIGIFKQTLSSWVNFEHAGNDADKNNPSGTDSDSINLDNLKANAMGDEQFLKEMIALFVTQGAEQITNLKTYCTDGKDNSWVEVSHALKGTAGSVGAEAMHHLCAQAQVMEESTAQEREAILDNIEEKYIEAKSYFISENLYEE